MDEAPRKKHADLTVTIAVLIWAAFLPLLVSATRHYLRLPFACILALPIVISGLVTLVPDKQLERRVRIGWRVVVIVAGILYSSLLFLLIVVRKR